MATIPASTARNATAFACSFMVYLAVMGGLVQYAALLQIAVLAGASAGLLAHSWKSAAACGALAVAAGWLVAAPFVDRGQPPVADTAGIVLTVIGAGIVAAAVRWGDGFAGRRFVAIAVPVLVALLVVNLWASATVITASPGRSLTALLTERPVPGTEWNDDAGFVELLRRVKEGTPYYKAYIGVMTDNAWWGPPDTVVAVRPPGIYLLLALIAPNTQALFFEMLLLGSLAVVAAAVLAGTLVRQRFALVGAAPVAAAFLYLATGGHLIYAESWAVGFALISLAALAYAATNDDWLVPFFVGVAFALLAAVGREFFLCVPVAGFAAAMAARPDRRRLQLTSWGVAGALIVAYYSVHVWNASRIVVSQSGTSSYVSPSLANIWSAAAYFTSNFGVGLGSAAWVPALLAAAGIVGAFVAPKGEVRRLLGGVVGVLLAFLFVFSNGATDAAGLQINYWGIAMMPLVFAFSPLVFRLVPGMARSRP